MDKEEIKQAFCHLNEEDLKIAYAGVKVDKSLTDAVKNRYSIAEKYFIQGAEWASSAQKQIDIDAVKFVLYNALEIGDIACKDVKRLIGKIEHTINHSIPK